MILTNGGDVPAKGWARNGQAHSLGLWADIRANEFGFIADGSVHSITMGPSLLAANDPEPAMARGLTLGLTPAGTFAPDLDIPIRSIALPLPTSRGQPILSHTTSGPRYYARPSFTGADRVFTDLAAYAPGMSSSQADIGTALEAEAAPRFGARRGSVDPQARMLIDSARSAAWVKSVVPLAGEGSLTVVHDGQGRYAYERRLTLGLIERVVCDGSKLLHLYPELGIGAKRTVSRFHRAEFAALCPDVLPPADDLAFGAEVKRIDERTVALVPMRKPEPEDVTKEARWIEEHLTIEAGRLTGRRWLRMPDKKVLGSERYEADGSVKRTSADDKELPAVKRTRGPADAPDL